MRGPGDQLLLLRLAARQVAGRHYWIAALLPLVWIGFQVLRLVVGWRPVSYGPAEAQTILIGFPLTILAIGLGGRIIAGEIDRRTLEIAYTVPGGTHRVWLIKLLAASLLLAASDLLMGLAAWLFCTSFPPAALYGAFQSAVFYMVLSMGLAALAKSEAAGALLVTVVLVVNLFIHQGLPRISPFFNPASRPDDDPAQLLAWTVQNRVGFLLVVAALVALSFGRAEQRERLLGG